jgi:predicted ATPase/DNA-binding winged helix-turn-helix (wHTH) protein
MPAGMSTNADETLAFGPFRLLPGRRVLLDGDQGVPLGNRALDLLIALVDNAGQTLSRDDLMACAWPGVAMDDSNLRVHLAALRKRLGDDGRRYIVNVPGRGYAFLAPVQRGSTTPAAAAPPPAATWQPPFAVPQVIGREALLDEVDTRLAASRLVSLVGPGGIGKTSLALAVAARRGARLAQGARFVDLAPVSDGRQLLAALAAALQIGQFGADLLPGVLAHLAQQKVLLVLDNCEQIVAAVAELAERLLRSLPGVELLITSREQLRCEGEWVQRLRPLSLPTQETPLSAAEALAYPGVQLFVERAGAAFDAFRFDDAAVPGVVEICRRLDGIPLAIELAAARMDMLGLRGLLAGLDDRFALLTRGRRTALPRQRTLAATLEWSHALLDADEQALFRRLAVFVGSFTPEAAAAVALDGDVASAPALLAGLVLKSILNVELGGSSATYRLPESVRHHAAGKLRDSGEEAATRARHAAQCLRQLHAANAEAATLPAKDWRQRHAPQIDDLREATQWSLQTPGQTATGIALAAHALPLWSQCAPLPDLRHIAETALQALHTAPHPAHEQALQATLGTCLFHTEATPAAAVPPFQRALALALAQQIGDGAAQLRSLSGLCASHIHLGDYSSAVAHAQAHEALATGTARLASHRLLAVSLHYAGNQRATQAHADQLLQGATAMAGGGSGVLYDQQVTVLTISAMNLWLRGRPDTAMRSAETALAMALKLAHPISICQTLANAACPIAIRNGDLQRAHTLVALLHEHASRHSLAAWRGWADIYAQWLCTGTVRDATLPGPQFETAVTLALHPAAPDSIERAARGQAGWCRAELLRLRGEHLAQRSPQQADALFEAAIALAREQGARAWELRAATSQARLWMAAQQHQRAHETLTALLAQFDEGHGTLDLRHARALLDQAAACR